MFGSDRNHAEFPRADPAPVRAHVTRPAAPAGHWGPGGRFGVVLVVVLGLLGWTAPTLARQLGAGPGGVRSASAVPAGAGPHDAVAQAAPAVPRLGAAAEVFQDDVGDPDVLTVPAGTPGNPVGTYVLFWTTDWQSNVPAAVSTDLVHWQRGADALPVLPSWATPSRTQTWAPSALQVNGGWVLYYSTQEASTGLQCIGVAGSVTPQGPYVDRSRAPLLCQRALGGDIDPSVTRDEAGLPSLAWKNDGNARAVPTSIWRQSLSADGLSLVADAHRLLGVDQGWQHGIVEGPAMLKRSAGGWWLFYSAGAWQSNTYSTGVAVCGSIDGPCRRTSSGPFLSSRPGAISPGGLETFVDLQGRLRASFSAFPEAPANPAAAMAENRVLELAPVLSS